MQLRKLETELRSRESREGTEVLMNALQAMQDKNSTLEKNLSAETRVKLDLFSALGEAKRQLEIRDSKYATESTHPDRHQSAPLHFRHHSAEGQGGPGRPGEDCAAVRGDAVGAERLVHEPMHRRRQLNLALE